MRSIVGARVTVKCHVCAVPEVAQINWLRHDQLIVDVNVLIQSETIDDFQCLQSIMKIIVRSQQTFSKNEMNLISIGH